MISKHVVLLLGAGASRGYGYPTGVELMANLTSINGDQLHGMEQAGIDNDDVMLFKDQFSNCGLNSVDAFLKRNPAFGRAAKMRIAQELCAAEFRAAHGAGRTETWIQYLFSQFMVGDSLEDFRSNRCTFVTLNYDRCLEFELTRMLRYAWFARTRVSCNGSISSRAVASRMMPRR